LKWTTLFEILQQIFSVRRENLVSFSGLLDLTKSAFCETFYITQVFYFRNWPKVLSVKNHQSLWSPLAFFTIEDLFSIYALYSYFFKRGQWRLVLSLKHQYSTWTLTMSCRKIKAWWSTEVRQADRQHPLCNWNARTRVLTQTRTHLIEWHVNKSNVDKQAN
jgi:hypothetical protein